MLPNKPSQNLCEFTHISKFEIGPLEYVEFFSTWSKRMKNTHDWSHLNVNFRSAQRRLFRLNCDKTLPRGLSLKCDVTENFH